MVAPTDTGASYGGHWGCHVVDAAGTWIGFTGVRSSRYADKTRVQLSAQEAVEQVGDDATCYITFGAERVITDVLVTPLAAPKAPPLWFGELRESASQPPAVHVLAFTGHDVRAGALLDESRLAETDVEAADQLGALRWYPATGEVDQIYVQPDWRRRSIALALVTAASTMAAAREWPRLWGDGQRTELGEQWRTAQPWRDRAAPLTHIAPPMTPPPPTEAEPAPDSLAGPEPA